MTQTYLCPCCKQPLPPVQRGGVYLPPMKAKLFDIVAASPGIMLEELAQRLGIKVSTTKVHVSQINTEWLISTDVRIGGDGRWGYVIAQQREQACA